MERLPNSLDCACVIHGESYSWEYVDKLYSMLARHISRPIQLHVYTENDRNVPAPYIKHVLADLGVSGPKKSWWYKMMLFDATEFSGDLLYFDLDVVITKKIDWIWQLPTRYFWSVRDFNYLWKPTQYDVNSSIMWWNTEKFNFVWQEFKKYKIGELMLKYHGDQNFITNTILQDDRKCFNTELIKSWRWQALDGGYNFSSRQYTRPNSGTNIADNTEILVFHGNPKPKDIMDSVIIQHWR